MHWFLVASSWWQAHVGSSRRPTPRRPHYIRFYIKNESVQNRGWEGDTEAGNGALVTYRSYAGSSGVSVREMVGRELGFSQRYQRGMTPAKNFGRPQLPHPSMSPLQTPRAPDLEPSCLSAVVFEWRSWDAGKGALGAWEV